MTSPSFTLSSIDSSSSSSQLELIHDQSRDL